MKRAVLLILLASCLRNQPPVTEPAPVEIAAVAAAPDPRFVRPEPLERRPFVLPEVHRGVLSNGVEVMVVENHEIPAVDVRIVFPNGAWSDPAGMEGLAVSAMGMLDEGAGTYDAVGFSAAQRKLASNVWAGAGLDSSSASLHCLKKNLEPTLDLWAQMLLKPRFDKGEWDRVRKQRVQEVQEQRTSPDAMAGRALDRVLFGDAYQGRNPTEKSVGKPSAADLKRWYQTQIHPGRAVILVGGDTTLAEIVPLLEARLGGWKKLAAPVDPQPAPVQPTATTVYLVDKPGAAQSVLRAARFVPKRGEAGFDALIVGNTAWGGMFMARLNMNLREAKGYTYGARSGISHGLGPSIWTLSTSVKSEVTVESLREIFGELAAVQADRPLSDEEVAYFKSSLINGYPARFETTDYLLGEQSSVWRYGLPADWLAGWIDRVDRVSATDAQAAFAEHVASKPLAVVVVGDLAKLRGPIEALGYPIVVLDADGNLVR